MAGHSKWANIKHRKERADAKKGKVFSAIAKEIISAVKVGGPDPKANPRLRLAIQKARTANMPTDNVDRNIKKASSTDTEDFAEVTYEIYGHGGVGIVVEALTDNKNRTASDMRIATNKKVTWSKGVQLKLSKDVWEEIETFWNKTKTNDKIKLEGDKSFSKARNKRKAADMDAPLRSQSSSFSSDDSDDDVDDK